MEQQQMQVSQQDMRLVSKLIDARKVILDEMRKVVVGQGDVIDEILITLFAGGHSLITGVPGLAKTLIVKTLSDILNLSFHRIQFTPDLMPSDITGMDVIDLDPATGRREMHFVKGPVFASVILADEINRTPPKTQAALLEAMQEHHVTAAGVTYQLAEPFVVLATQNPIEMEGTYPLPEAQLDRFMFNIRVDHLSPDDEVAVVSRTTGKAGGPVKRVMEAQEVLDLQRIVREVPAGEHVVRYAVNLVGATRPASAAAPDFVKKWVAWGAGLRASQCLVLGAKVRALFNGRLNVSVKDIQALALPVLRHRVLTNFHAEAEKVDSEAIVHKLIEHVKPPASGM